MKNWCFWTVVLEKILASPLDCKEIQPVHPKGDLSRVFIGRTDVEAETPITLATWCEELTHLRRPWCWERWRASYNFTHAWCWWHRFWFLAGFNSICCSVTKLCLTLCDPMDCSTPGFPVLHYLLEFTQTHVPGVSNAIQPSHPLSSPSPPALNLSQHQGLFQWVSSSNQVAKVLELQLQCQPFQWILRVDFL